MTGMNSVGGDDDAFLQKQTHFKGYNFGPADDHLFTAA